MRLPRRRPEPAEDRLIWLFSPPRSGTTWLLGMLSSHPRVGGVNEPLIGAHLAPFFPELLHDRMILYPDVEGDRPDYFFSERHATSWRPHLRRMVLDRLAPPADRMVAIKEPNGSQAAPTIMSLLPRSRMIMLVRDGRDAVDSNLAALEPEGWMGRGVGVERPLPREGLIEQLARVWLLRTEQIERAYESHPPELRFRLDYEAILTAPAAKLAATFDWLGLAYDRDLLDRIVDEYAFENLGRRGPQSFARSATPGLWREHFSPAEQELLVRIIGPKLRELGYED